MDYTLQDLSLRLVEIWYDMTWAFFVSNNIETVAARMDRYRSASSSASVSTLATENGSVVNKGMQEKMALLMSDLKRVRTLMRYAQFKEICNVSLTRNDDLYPGFKDVLEIAKKLMNGEAAEDLNIACVFQSIYYRFCDFLVGTDTGYQMAKMIITPTRTSQAVYDICRQKFCRVMCEEVSIIEKGLADLVVKRPPPQPSSPKTALTVVDTPAVAEQAPPSPTFSMVSGILPKRAPFAGAFGSKVGRSDDGVRFPLVEMSDDSDDSDVSSLGDDM